LSTRLDGLDEIEIPGVDVQPGVRTTVFVTVGDRPFQPVMIEIDHDVAPHFLLSGFRVGGSEQFAPPIAAQPVPAAIFARGNVGRLTCEVCKPGGALELDVFNQTGDVQRFAVTFAGRRPTPRQVVTDDNVRELLERVRRKN